MASGPQPLTHVEAHPAQADESELHCALPRSEEHTSELQSRRDLVCRLLLEKKKDTLPARGSGCCGSRYLCLFLCLKWVGRDGAGCLLEAWADSDTVCADLDRCGRWCR